MKNVLCLLLLAVAAQASEIKPQVSLQVSGAVSGTIVLELDAQKAPVTVANFIGYVQSGFYDGAPGRIYYRPCSY